MISQTPVVAMSRLMFINLQNQSEYIFKKWKTCTVFLSSCRNTSESLGEKELLWERDPNASLPTAFSQTFKTISITP